MAMWREKNRRVVSGPTEGPRGGLPPTYMPPPHLGWGTAKAVGPLVHQGQQDRDEGDHGEHAADGVGALEVEANTGGDERTRDAEEEKNFRASEAEAE